MWIVFEYAADVLAGVWTNEYIVHLGKICFAFQTITVESTY